MSSDSEMDALKEEQIKKLKWLKEAKKKEKEMSLMKRGISAKLGDELESKVIPILEQLSQFQKDLSG